MAKKTKQSPAKKRMKPQQTDIETASEYTTIDDLKRKGLVEGEMERE
ncbi:MAG: hypothetical protein WBI44_02955 [Syntrophaceticus sp.]